MTKNIDSLRDKKYILEGRLANYRFGLVVGLRYSGAYDSLNEAIEAAQTELKKVNRLLVEAQHMKS